MKIHPSAVVEDGARLADDVEVGPGAIIGKDVQLGKGCVVRAHAVLTSRVIVGERNQIGYGCVIGSEPQDFAHNDSVTSEVRIGSGNIFREYVTIHRGTKEGSATVVGNDNYLMAGSHLGHNVQVGNRIIIANNCLLGGYVEVYDNSVLGGGTVFHQFMRVGRCVMVRGGTRFGQDIPPYSIGDEDNVLAGINTIGLRRNGFSVETRKEIHRAFHLVFRSGYNISQALEKARETEWGPEVRHFLEFITESKRGVCPSSQRKLRHVAEAAE